MATPAVPSPVSLNARIASIDVLRALTMVLMIFVNDLWTLHDIPFWLEHVAPGVDGIGLADVVFPAFLFIVGLSLPVALQARIAKGETRGQLLRHIAGRSFALLVMGVFLVNGEYIHEAATGLSRSAWNTVCCTSFILIWNRYPKSFPVQRMHLLKGIAICTLLILAWIYRGDGPEQLTRFQPRWWGILGLIGWSYLAGATVTIWANKRIWLTVSCWAFFALLSMLEHAHLLPDFLHVIPDAIRGGTLTALTLGGVLTAQVLGRYPTKEQAVKLSMIIIAIAAIWIAASLLTRPYWGLAKLGATPAWLFLCSAFTLLAFVSVYWLTDRWGKENWFAFIRPAGTDTLLTYLVPYFSYAAVAVWPVHLPELLLSGGIGLFKSVVFALACVGITKLAVRMGIRLKI